MHYACSYVHACTWLFLSATCDVGLSTVNGFTLFSLTSLSSKCGHAWGQKLNDLLTHSSAGPPSASWDPRIHAQQYMDL